MSARGVPGSRVMTRRRAIQLVAGVMAVAACRSSRPAARPAGRDAVLQAFVNGETTTVDGWVLATAEAEMALQAARRM